MPSAMTHAAFAQEDYAEPKGEDEYGETYQVRQVPTEMTAALDGQCGYVIESFIDRTIYRGQEEWWVIEQIPAAGTLVTGPQTVSVQLKHTRDTGEERWASLPITTLDVTPPQIDVLVDSNGEPHTSFGNIQRYVTPVAVLPILMATDACDADPAFEELTHNGDPYLIGAAITDVGLHIIQATAIDASGNRSDASVVFEIRARPSRTAASVVQDTQCEIAPDGLSGAISATILISAADFDHRDILLSSVRVMLRGDDGTYLNDVPLPIKGGFPPNCEVFQQHLADAELNECWLAIDIEGAFTHTAAGGCPVGMDIIGATAANGALVLEWGARNLNVADATPQETLMSAVGKPLPCAQPQPPPTAPPTVNCQKVETWIDWPRDICSQLPTIVGQCAASGGDTKAVATPTALQGRSTSTAATDIPTGQSPEHCSVDTTGCEVQSGTILLVQMVGNCCNCVIGFNVNASVYAAVRVTGAGSMYGGSATANSDITFTTPCGSGSKSANISISGMSQGPLIAPALGSPLNCSVNACASWLHVRTSGTVITSANASSSNTLNATCTAVAQIKGIATLSASGAASACPPCVP